MSRINEILQEMDELKKELRSELAKEIDNKAHHKGWSFSEFITYFKTIPLGTLLSSPIIYAMVIPAVILDIFLWIYQNINFRVYKIPLVKRSDYIVYDRALEYLHPIDKLACVYCSYFNGLMAYSSEIASRTELYFCPIKHKKRLGDSQVSRFEEKKEEIAEIVEKNVDFFRDYWDILFGIIFGITALYLHHIHYSVLITTIAATIAIASISVTISEIAEILAHISSPFSTIRVV
jgi:hypothetical protein